MPATLTRPRTSRTSPCDLSARALAGRIVRGDLSARDAVDAFLERIDERNPTLNAVVSVDAPRARAAAKRADEARKRGRPLGPLHGVPITLKDGHDVAGLRTTLGTRELDRVATEDGTVAARLIAAGAIILGHTNVAPWLSDYQSANPVFGRTSNPWDSTRTAGGSSGGGAAAVAAGMTPFDVVSDLAGSTRQPSHFCGVYGLKTTEHRVSLTGFFRPPPGAPNPVRIMSALGPVARNLGDLHLALSLIAGPDGTDCDIPPMPLGAPRKRPVDSVRLAYARTLPGVKVAKALQDQVTRVASEAGRAGATVKQSLPDVDWDAMNRLFGELVQCITGLFAPGARLSEEQRSLAWYLTSLAQRDRFAGAWELFFADFDALIVPPATTAAFTHRPPGTPLEIDGGTAPYEDQGLMLVFCNLLGLPSLTVPAGFDDDGLPIGIQIVGPRWAETRLIEIASALEESEVLPGFVAPRSARGTR